MLITATLTITPSSSSSSTLLNRQPRTCCSRCALFSFPLAWLLYPGPLSVDASEYRGLLHSTNHHARLSNVALLPYIYTPLAVVSNVSSYYIVTNPDTTEASTMGWAPARTNKRPSPLKKNPPTQQQLLLDYPFDCSPHVAR